MCSLGSFKNPEGQKELPLALCSGKGCSAGCDVKDLSCSYDSLKLINKILFPLTHGPVIQSNLVHVLTGSSVMISGKKPSFHLPVEVHLGAAIVPGAVLQPVWTVAGMEGSFYQISLDSLPSVAVLPFLPGQSEVLFSWPGGLSPVREGQDNWELAPGALFHGQGERPPRKGRILHGCSHPEHLTG